MKTGSVKTLLIAMMFLTACGSGDLPGLAWNVTDERLVLAFEIAAAEWCEMSDGEYCPYIDPQSEIRVHAADPSDPDVKGHNGWYDPSHDIAIVMREVCSYPCSYKRTIAHKLGHAAGADGHMQSGVGVMTSFKSSEDVTQEDVEFVFKNN